MKLGAAKYDDDDAGLNSTGGAPDIIRELRRSTRLGFRTGVLQAHGAV
jgi:hypothetical protein